MEKKAGSRVLTTKVTLLTNESEDTGITKKSQVRQKISDIVKREPEKKRKVSKVLNSEPEGRQRPEVFEREPEVLNSEPEDRQESEVLKREPESKRESEVFEREPEEQKRSEVLSKEPEAKQTGKSLAAELVFSVFLIAAVCAFRTVLIYANNTDKLSFFDAARPMWIIMGISIAAFAVLRLIFRRPHFACVFVAFGTFLYINLDWLVAFMRLFVNEYKPAAIGSLILYGLLLVGFFFFLRLLYKKNIRINAVVNILAATFMCLVLFNVVTAFMAVGHAASKDDPEPTVTVAAVETPSAPMQSAVPTSSGEAVSPVSDEFGLPNIYFFILDEFSSFDVLQKYYGYDAKPLNDYLVSAGFNISRESYGTDSQTEHALCDLMNLEYISKYLSKEECLDNIHNAELHKVLKGLGYSEYQIANSTYFKGIDSLISGGNEEGDTTPTDKTDFGDVGIGDITGGLGGIIGDLLNNPDANTVVDEAALNKFGFYPTEYIRNSPEYRQYKNKSDDARSKLSRGDGLLEKFGYLQDQSNFAGLDTPRITYSYMLATHVPFVFNEYGGIIPHSQNRNWEDTSVYLDQYKFINKQLIATVSSIISSDPDSIIIIMSDHGIRYHAESNLKLKHTFYITNKDSCRIMNAVYIKGKKYDIEGLSGVNTLRYILSLYDGQDYPLIDDPVNPDSPDDLKGIIPRPR